MQMPEDSPAARPLLAALLYAGLILNAGLLEMVGHYDSLLAHSVRLCLVLLLYSAFLGLGVLYAPLRYSGTIEDMVRVYVGRTGEWLFSKLMTPVWLVAWFSFNALTATFLCKASAKRCGMIGEASYTSSRRP